jgi:hypothetical protein
MAPSCRAGVRVARSRDTFEHLFGVSLDLFEHLI